MVGVGDGVGSWPLAGSKPQDALCPEIWPRRAAPTLCHQPACVQIPFKSCDFPWVSSTVMRIKTITHITMHIKCKTVCEAWGPVNGY